MSYQKWYLRPSLIGKLTKTDPSRILVIDTETTGLDRGKDEILQLAICDADGNEVYNQKFRPAHTYSWPDAERINHISPKDVRSCPKIRKCRSQISEIVGRASVVVAYNWGFDGEFLEAAGISVHCDVFDVMLEYGPVAGEWNGYYGDWKFQKLSACALHYGYDWGKTSAHDALADAKATAFCMRSMAKDGSDYRETANLISKSGEMAAKHLYAGGSRVADELSLPKADVPDDSVVFCWIQNPPEKIVGKGTQSAIDKAIEERGGRRYKSKAKGAKWYIYTDPTAASSWFSDQIESGHKDGKKVCYLPDLLDYLEIEAKTARKQWDIEFRKSRKWLDKEKGRKENPRPHTGQSSNVSHASSKPSGGGKGKDTAMGCGCLLAVVVIGLILIAIF